MIWVKGKTLIRGLTVISNLWTITKSFCPPYDFAIPELREKYLKEYQLFPDDFFESAKNYLPEARAFNPRVTHAKNQYQFLLNKCWISSYTVKPRNGWLYNWYTSANKGNWSMDKGWQLLRKETRVQSESELNIAPVSWSGQSEVRTPNENGPFSDRPDINFQSSEFWSKPWCYQTFYTIAGTWLSNGFHQIGILCQPNTGKICQSNNI